jgi:glycosyltransferase involved in cell wall biosynthesis
MNSKKILVISPKFPPQFSGGSRIWIHNLLNLDFEDIEGVVLTAEKKLRTSFNLKKFTIIENNYMWDGVDDESPTKFIQLRMLVGIIIYIIFNGKKYDYILANAFDFNNSIIILLSKLLRFQVIICAYGEEYSFLLNRRGIYWFIRKWFVKISHRYVKGIICVSEFTALQVKQLNKNVYINYTIIPPFLNHISMRNVNYELNNNFTYKFKILSVGRLIERKGFLDLMRAVYDLRDKLNVELNIVGNGPYEGLIRKFIKEYKCDNFIFLHTNLKQEYLINFYEKADLFVLANRMLKNGDTEGSPVVFSEAALFGLPILAGIDSGADMVVKNNINGFILDMENNELLKIHILSLYEDKELRIKMGQNSKIICNTMLKTEKWKAEFEKIFT